MAVIIYFISFLLSWVFLHHFLSQRSRGYKRFPPGPTPLPVIGNLLNLGNKPHISLANLAKIHGPVMCLQLGGLNTVVITSPSAAKEVLQKNDAAFANVRTIPDATRACNHAELSMTWLSLEGMGKTLRKIASSEIFTSSRLDAMSHIRRQKVADLLSHVDACCQAEVPVHMSEAVFTTALNLMSSTFFSENVASLSSSSDGTNNLSGESHADVVGKEFKGMIMRIMVEAGKSNLSDFFPYLKWFDLQGRKACIEIEFSKLLGFFDELIDKRMDTRLSSGDTLDTLLKLTHENINGFNRPFITHMLLDLFMGGTETTSTAIEWAMSELLRNPTKMKKVQKELEQVIGKENPVVETDISKLPYLQAVFKETMRLHPTIPFLLPRKASADINVSSFLVPKDSQVMVNVWAIQKDPNVWEDALDFKPERFLESNTDLKGLCFELLPFGSGRRICPGITLAIRFVPMALASLIHSFDWKLEDGTTSENLDMQENFGLTLHKAQPLKAIPINKF